jgi:hypothetical protein
MTATACRPPVEVLNKAHEHQLVLGRDCYGPIWRLAGQNPWMAGTSRVLGERQRSAAERRAPEGET